MFTLRQWAVTPPSPQMTPPPELPPPKPPSSPTQLRVFALSQTVPGWVQSAELRHPMHPAAGAMVTSQNGVDPEQPL